MNHVDVVNAVFEGGGAVLLTLNVRRLMRDKQVSGISLIPTFWWTLWGFWNVYFYAKVNTPASFVAGIFVVAVNAVWVALALYYKRKAKQAADYQIEALILFTPDGGRTWHNGEGPLEASPLTDRLQDYYYHRTRTHGSLQ